MSSPRTLLSAAALAAVFLAGCGSDQDPAIDPPDEVTTTSTTAAAPPPGGATGEVITYELIELTGAAEVPGPGDDDGDGLANVFLEPDQGRICYDINVNGIGTATAAHIHEGGEDESGPVVVPLQPPAEGAIDGCAPAEAELIDRIEADPSGFYVNVHNAEFPDGAVRGQLVEDEG